MTVEETPKADMTINPTLAKWTNQPMTKEEFFIFFKQTTDNMYNISRSKNSDYTGLGVSPYANFERVEQLGICTTEQGFLTRMSDKLSRIASYCAKGDAFFIHPP